MLDIRPAAPKTADHIAPLTGAGAKVLAASMGTGDERERWRYAGPLAVLCCAAFAALLLMS